MSVETNRRASGPAAGDLAMLPGCKRTQVGVIPEEWSAVKLGDLATFRTGPFGSALHKADYIDGGIPLINPMHIVNGHLVPEAETSVSEQAAHRLAVFRLRFNDIVIGRRGDMGRCAVVQDRQVGWLCGTGSLIIRPSDRVDPSFLQRVLTSERSINSIEDASVGSTMVNLNQAALSGLPIPLPPLSEQRTIAEALSDVDGLLGTLEALIAKKRAIKQAAMQQLLTGKTRLPGFSGAWETKRLGDVVDRLVGGGTPSRSNPAFWGDDIPWVTVKDFATFNPQGTQESITRLGLNNSASHVIPAGTLITSTRMALGKAVVFEVDVAINQDLKAVFLRPSASVRFLFYWFECNARMIDDLGSGSTVKGISIGQLAALPFPSLSLDEQTAIATVLSDMDAEIAALKRRHNKTRAIKHGMMQQLLTGRVRLVEFESEEVGTQATVTERASSSHSWAFNEAVVIATLAKHFGKEEFPLGRKRYTKLSYLLHRQVERQAEGYLKKAAGPYNPKTKYGGPERIAMERSYARKHKHGRYTGFVAADNVDQAEIYFERWYGAEALQWLEQFRFQGNDELELLATVDMAVEELRASGRTVDVATVKGVIGSHPEWEAKLDRTTFSDANIGRAIERASELFGDGGQR